MVEPAQRGGLFGTPSGSFESGESQGEVRRVPLPCRSIVSPFRRGGDSEGGAQGGEDRDPLIGGKCVENADDEESDEGEALVPEIALLEFLSNLLNNPIASSSMPESGGDEHHRAIDP